MSIDLQKWWTQLLAQNPANDDLRYIIEYVEALREKAGIQLLAQNPTNDDLRYIIEYVEALREQAEAMLPPSLDELMEQLKRSY